PREHFAEVLSRFDSITDRCLHIQTDWLMPAICDRLRRRRTGWWELQITRPINQGDIDFALALYTDLRLCRRNGGEIVIRILKTMYRVAINTRDLDKIVAVFM
ncbi:hypothetical protein PMAYCL1PPCAC_03794, partial [Pristionchus mayeri]